MRCWLNAAPRWRWPRPGRPSPLAAGLRTACGLAAALILALAWPALAGTLQLEGEALPGALLQGQLPPGSAVHLDGRPLRVDAEGRFAFGIGRSAREPLLLTVRYPDGSREQQRLEVGARSFDVQRIDGLPPRKVEPAAGDLRRIEAEARQLRQARARDSALSGFAEPLLWPAEGRISGVFGSQRILNGVARSPHLGLDIAANFGSPVAATASGVVSVAEPDLYFTGGTVVIDHGHGVHSLYAHLSHLDVAEGANVRQGETVGRIGATGRATGAHLHWGLYWFDQALDPALAAGARETQ